MKRASIPESSLGGGLPGEPLDLHQTVRSVGNTNTAPASRTGVQTQYTCTRDNVVWGEEALIRRDYKMTEGSVQVNLLIWEKIPWA